MPTDLLLASLSSCYALALAWAARKQGFDLPDLEVSATGTYQGQKFASLRADRREQPPGRAADRVAGAGDAVCYVSNTFRAVPELRVELA